MQEFYLKQTFKLARQSVQNGNHPCGALLVLDNKIVAESENTVLSESDITKHAELNLISKISRRLTLPELNRAILYTSTEPCAMCTGAVVWSGIKRIVYGCSGEELNSIAKGKFSIECRKILNHSVETYHVEGPILSEEASQIHRDFWD